MIPSSPVSSSIFVVRSGIVSFTVFLNACLGLCFARARVDDFDSFGYACGIGLAHVGQLLKRFGAHGRSGFIGKRHDRKRGSEIPEVGCHADLFVIGAACGNGFGPPRL